MDGPRSKEPAGRTTSDGYGIKADERYYLKLNPDSLGPQHDEHEPGWFGGRFKWAEACGRSSPRRSCIPASSNGSQRKLACSTTTRPRHTGAQEPQRHLKLTAYYTAPPPSEEPH